MSQARKYDGGKLRWDLLPLHLVEKVVEVYTFGAQKYVSENDGLLNMLDNPAYGKSIGMKV